PSFDQADVSLMPMFVRDLPQFTAQETAAIDDLYRKRIRSLQAVDRGVARLVRTLRTTGQLDNTYIVFTSDNGFHLGQHRMPAGKQTAYEEDIHVPLIVRGPGIPAGSTDSAITGNVDLAPTFAALAGVRAPSFVDGRSFAGELGVGSSRPRPRTAYLLEHWKEVGGAGARGGAPLAPTDPDQGSTTSV